MTVIIKSGLVQCVDYVRDFFATNGVSATCELGWRRRDRQLNQGAPLGANRVVFTPSDSGGAGGTLVPARFPGPRTLRDAGQAMGTVRSLRDWERAVTVSVWAVDPTKPNDEASQIEASETLFEWVVRAVHSAPGAFAEMEWGAVQWTEPPERSFGLELIASLTFKHPIFDVPRELVFPSGAAVKRAPYVPPTAPSSDGDT